MKNIKYMQIALIAFCLTFFAPKVWMQEVNTVKNDFRNMSFEAEINKTEYLLLEPIEVNFKYSNQSGKGQTTFSPDFLGRTILKVSFGDKSREIRNIFGLSIQSIRFARQFNPGESVEEIGLLQPSNGFFTEPGIYRIQFLLQDAGGVERLESPTFEITVKQPSGIDKEAFDFLKTHRNKSAINLFSLNNSVSENESSLLETFVNQYSNSAYGEYAIFNLGNVYEFKGDLDRAKVEFEKIKESRHKMLAKVVQKSLSATEDKIKEKDFRNKLSKQAEKP